MIAVYYAAGIACALLAGFLAGIWYCSPDHMPPQSRGESHDIY